MNATRLAFGLVGLALAAHLVWLSRRREPVRAAAMQSVAIVIVVVAFAVAFQLVK